AMLLTPSILKGLRIHRDYLHVIVSLDGTALAHDAARIYRKGKGSFEEVTQGLDLLQEACILTSISVTLGEHNKDHLKTLIDFLLERDIYSMGIDPVRIVSEESTPDSLADALIDAIEYARSRNFHISGLWEGVCERLENGAIGSFCGGSGAELSVLPSGEIFPCQSQPIRLGTLEDLKTRALFTTEAYHQVSMRVVGNLPDCRGCEIEGMCVGGCAADAYATEQNLYGRTKYCKFLQKMVRHHLAYLAELAYMDKSDSF
ncbi:MAG: SPASM domain-containing protein, partial [Rhizobiaceae bacterium]